jgi:hypothetical protein
MSYIEKTARKLYPILTELKRRMIPEKRPKTRSDSIVAAMEDDSDELVIDLAAEQ